MLILQPYWSHTDQKAGQIPKPSVQERYIHIVRKYILTKKSLAKAWLALAQAGAFTAQVNHDSAMSWLLGAARCPSV